jgi:catechol 2,3-dioxygenase-like lactoylglutathione lyase family enzyme
MPRFEQCVGGKEQHMSLDMKLEVVVVPVANIERAMEFYARIGWRLDADVPANDGSRLIQFTPPGSWCSIQFGSGMTSAAPGSVQGLYLIVSDIEAARSEFFALGVETSDVFHCSEGFSCRFTDNGKRIPGAHPERLTGRSYLTFSDPDGNRWIVQELASRLPGRVVGNTSFTSVRDLAQAMIRASKAHGQHEKQIGHAEPDWPEWYARFMVREQSGEG